MIQNANSFDFEELPNSGYIVITVVFMVAIVLHLVTIFWSMVVIFSLSTWSPRVFSENGIPGICHFRC